MSQHASQGPLLLTGILSAPLQCPLFPLPCPPPFLGPQSLLCPPVGVLLSGVSLWVQPPGGQVALGDRLVLSCTVAMGTGPLSFSWHREGTEALLGTKHQLELPHVGDNDSGQYRCRVSDGDSVAESDPLNVTVLVPVADATITPGPLAHQVHTGDNVTLRCSVQVGSAPVTFTWLKNGQELARGPLSFSWHREGSGALPGTGPQLELPHVGDNDSGQYRCRVSDGDSVAEKPPYPLGEGEELDTERAGELFSVPVLEGPPEPTEGSPLTLSCLSTPSPLRPRAPLLRERPKTPRIPCLVPVANATIIPGPLAHQVHTGDNVTLRCSVQVGSAPVTFTWLHNGQEVAPGPFLDLRNID
ncbi:Fc receptor-like protein 2, partial [Passer montanus]|uniref:Fc receptor-like protein 2 n=1 Tax=Passer montanus TaxID=9160 RepID=UPI001960F67B